MRKFSSTLFTHISNTSKISVYELRKNGNSLFETFVREIDQKGNLFDKLAGAIRIVEETSNLQRYPKTKFRQIKGHNLGVKVYEAKSGLIRIYLFHEKKTGRIIVTGGLKDNQEKNLRSILKIIKQYQDEKRK